MWVSVLHAVEPALEARLRTKLTALREANKTGLRGGPPRGWPHKLGVGAGKATKPRALCDEPISACMCAQRTCVWRGRGRTSNS